MKYLFKFTHILLLSVLFQNCNKKATSVFIACDAINIQDFGAVPNDGKDDSKAIQAAIDFAIHEGKSSLVYCPAGVYDLDKGVVIANQKKDGEYFFVTLTLTGPIAAYSGNQLIGKTAVFNLKNPTFAVALQSARNCVVQNIVFQGCAKFNNSANEIINWSESKDAKKSNINTNINSPSCAIVIDPFHKQVSTENQYKGFLDKYSNASRGGSSMILMNGLSFSNHYIAIANNSSGWVQNGDNIRVENSHAASCHTFWSCGQTQSRSNSIQNVYVTTINTFISGTQIGNQIGTPPTITNLNLAGFCKYLADISTGFAPFYISQSHIESIWSLGRINANEVSFVQTQIKFIKPSIDYFLAPFQLHASSVVSFDNCSLEYFDNCKTPMPITIKSKSVLLNGGHIEGGVLVANGITNNGGDELHSVIFNNVNLKCQNSIASNHRNGLHISKLYNQVWMGGSKFTSSEGIVIENISNTYDLIYITKKKIVIDSGLKLAYMHSDNPGQFKIGDNIFVNGPHNFEFKEGLRLQLHINAGFVSEISENKIILSGISEVLNQTEYDIFIVEYPRYLPSYTLNVTKNSNVGMLASDLDVYQKIQVGTRLKSKLLPPGTYISKITNNEVLLSAKALESGNVLSNKIGQNNK